MHSRTSAVVASSLASVAIVLAAELISCSRSSCENYLVPPPVLGAMLALYVLASWCVVYPLMLFLRSRVGPAVSALLVASVGWGAMVAVLHRPAVDASLVSSAMHLLGVSFLPWLAGGLIVLRLWPSQPVPGTFPWLR
jgi:hypothetical protein